MVLDSIYIQDSVAKSVFGTLLLKFPQFSLYKYEYL